jgi:hypothetical protein
MINCIATIAVFRPYRRTFLRLTTSCMPEDARRHLYQSTTTFATKGALTTISHWSKHATRFVFLWTLKKNFNSWYSTREFACETVIFSNFMLT